MLFIWQLPKQDQLSYYKRIKAALISEGCYNLENLQSALDSKINDIRGLI